MYTQLLFFVAGHQEWQRGAGKEGLRRVRAPSPSRGILGLAVREVHIHQRLHGGRVRGVRGGQRKTRAAAPGEEGGGGEAGEAAVRAGVQR